MYSQTLTAIISIFKYVNIVCIIRVHRNENETIFDESRTVSANKPWLAHTELLETFRSAELELNVMAIRSASARPLRQLWQGITTQGQSLTSRRSSIIGLFDVDHKAARNAPRQAGATLLAVLAGSQVKRYTA